MKATKEVSATWNGAEYHIRKGQEVPAPLLEALKQAGLVTEEKKEKGND